MGELLTSVSSLSAGQCRPEEEPPKYGATHDGPARQAELPAAGHMGCPLDASPRAYASRFLRLTAHLEDFFEKSSVRGGGDPLAGNAHLGRMLFEQAQGDPPQHGEVLGPASALQPTGILAEVDVHVPRSEERRVGKAGRS